MAQLPACDILFAAEDATHTLCIPFQVCPPENFTRVEYRALGVEFSDREALPPVAIYTDPPDSFAGLNKESKIDLLSNVNGRIVSSGTSTQGGTDLISVSAGLVASSDDILLEAFDASGAVVGSSLGDDGFDADGHHVAIVDLTGNPIITSFRVSTPTSDTFGVHQICLNTPLAVHIFDDGFESGDTLSWSSSLP